MNMNPKDTRLYKFNLKKLNKLINFALTIVIIAIFITGGVIVHARNYHRGIERPINSEQHSIKGQREDNKASYISEFYPGQQNDFLESPDISICYVDTSAPNDGGILSCLGEFKVTAYTAGFESTGKPPDHPEYGITASGEMVVEHLTIAADWDVIPYGTWVYIEDVGYRLVQDKGGAIKDNCIDLYIPDLGQAQEWGVQYKRVWLVK